MSRSPSDKFAALRETLESTIRTGDASTAPADRELAFERPGDLGGARGQYCAQVALDANGVTDDDVAALRSEGLGDTEIFEYTVAAAVGQANRQMTADMASLQRSLREVAP